MRENVAFDDAADAMLLEQVADIAQVSRFVDHLPQGWETVLGERGVTLSGGQRQRVALARALLNRPSLILADEPTGNLDPENADVVLASLRQFATDGGTVILVTHDDRAATAADRVLMMADGQFQDPN